MRKFAALFCFSVWLAAASWCQFSFHLVDNFEGGDLRSGAKWWKFGGLKMAVAANGPTDGRDLISESCGNYSLELAGETADWYIGGLGTDLSVSAGQYSRFQIDVSGSGEAGGKLVVELFDDDNFNYSIEQDPRKNYEAVFDDKWVAELNILGPGFTRYSVPFTAFKDVNPGIGDDLWNPDQAGGSGGLLKIQLVAIAGQQFSPVDFKIDNIILTY